jgi:hypothetical protein
MTVHENGTVGADDYTVVKTLAGWCVSPVHSTRWTGTGSGSPVSECCPELTGEGLGAAEDFCASLSALLMTPPAAPPTSRVTYLADHVIVT